MAFGTPDTDQQLTPAQWQALLAESDTDKAKPRIAPAAPPTALPTVGANQPTTPAAAPSLPTVGGAIPDLAKPTRQESNIAGKKEYALGLPNVTAPAFTPEWAQQQEEQAQFKRLHPLGSDISSNPGVGGKILHGLAKFGNIAGDILAPGITANIPGSDLYNRAQENRFQKQFTGAIGNQEEQAKTGFYNAAAWKDLNPQAAQPGKTPDEIALAARQRILGGTATPADFQTWQSYSDLKQAAQDVKPDDPMKQPVGAEGAQQTAAELQTLTQGMTPDAKQAFLSAYAPRPTDSVAEANKRLEDAKASAQLSGAERDRKIAQDAIAVQRQFQNAETADTHRRENEQEGMKTVQYRDKEGNLVSGSLADARAAGGTGIRVTQPAEEQKARTAITQYDRMLQNAQSVSDTLGAWDNPKDKELAIRIKNNFFSHGVIPGVGIDPQYIDSLLNSNDFKNMTPAGQAHVQNMFTLYSDAINVMKQETGGVPRGEQFLKVEGAILPQPEKTQLQNRQALKQFETRIKTDSSEYARPSDMPPLGGVIPPDAQSKIMSGGRTVGYKDANGKIVRF